MYILLLLLLLLLIIYTRISNIENFNEDPCSNKLSDIEYLYHMIPHHQVAVDISLLLQKQTKNPVMQGILRNLIWIQQYEIDQMKYMLNGLPTKISAYMKMNKKYISTIADCTPPNTLCISNTYCDPHFFNPEEHMKHLKHMKLTDISYIEHMIPHHQVAVDMSKKLLKNTKNDFMIYLAYRIIRSQENEIILLSNLLEKGNIIYKSNLVV